MSKLFGKPILAFVKCNLNYVPESDVKFQEKHKQKYESERNEG